MKATVELELLKQTAAYLARQPLGDVFNLWTGIVVAIKQAEQIIPTPAPDPPPAP